MTPQNKRDSLANEYWNENKDYHDSDGVCAAECFKAGWDAHTKECDLYDDVCAENQKLQSRIAELEGLLTMARTEFVYRKLDFELIQETKGWNHQSIPRCEMMITAIEKALTKKDGGV